MWYKIIGLMLFMSWSSISTSQAIGFEAAIGGWRQSIDGTLAYEPLMDSDIADIDDELQLDDETPLFGRIKIDMPLFLPNIYVIGAPAEFEGSGRKSVDFKFGDSTFNAQADLKSKLTMDQYDIGLYYGLPFVELGTMGILNIDVGLNVRIMDLEASIVGLSGQTNVNEQQSLTVPIPMLYLGAQLMPTDRFMVEAEGRGISIGDNKIYSLIGRLRYKLAGPMFIAGGYRFDKVEVDEDDIVVDVDLSGVFAEIGIAF